MANIAIIPARGGSKRIPRKNIKPFLGKPIISYSIEAAIESQLFDEVMVSTDDEEIAEISRKYGAVVPFLRSDKNADDLATTIDVITEVIESYKKIGKEFEYGCCIYPSAPFTTTKKLLSSFSFLLASHFDCVFPAIKFGYPIQRAIIKKENDRMEMLNIEYLNTRSQDLQTTYHDAGQYYCFNIDKLLSENKLWTDNTGIVVIDEMSAHDIDNPEDWELAEFKFEYLKKKNDL